MVARENQAIANGTDGHYMGWTVTRQNAVYFLREILP